MELNIEEFDTKDLIKMSFLKLEEGSSKNIYLMRV